MIAFTNLTGLATIVILIATLAVMLFRLVRIPQRYCVWLTLVIIVIVCFPIPSSGLPLAAYLRGLIGDLSITSTILLVLTLTKHLTGWQPFEDTQKTVLAGLIILAAAALYPLALGNGYVDPYRLGFGNLWFLGAISLVLLAAYLKKYYLVVLCIALAIFAWSVGWNEATNLWNYLIDPFLAIYAIGVLICRAVSVLLMSRRGHVR